MKHLMNSGQREIGYLAPDKQQELLAELVPLANMGIKAMKRRLRDVHHQIAKQNNNTRRLSNSLLRKWGVTGLWGDACVIPSAHLYQLQAEARFACGAEASMAQTRRGCDIDDSVKHIENPKTSVKPTCGTLPPCNTGTSGHGWPKSNKKRNLGGVKQC